MSCRPRGNLARFSSTAVIIAARDGIDTADRAARIAGRIPADQRLHLTDHRSLAVQRHRDRGARHRGRAADRRNSPDGSADAFDSAVVQQETADLVGSAEAVLHAAHHAQRWRPGRPRSAAPRRPGAPASAGPAMAPSLVTWPTSSIATPVGGAAILAQEVSAVVTARTWVTPPVTPSASVVDMVCTESTTTRVGCTCLDVAQRGLQVGFGGQVHLVVRASGALGPQPDLPGRLLAGQVQRAAADSGPAVRDLEQQRRLADPGIAGQQGHRAGDQAAAEHAVQFADRRWGSAG